MSPTLASHASATLFRQAIEEEMQSVNHVIRQQLHSDVPLVNQIGEYIISAGGKRIRPALVLLFARAHGYQGSQHHDLATIVEFIHTASLLHDDVVDESSLRRGRETANALFGNAASVLVGDFLYSRSFQMMVTIGDMRVMQILADATNIIAEGEVMQLLNMHDPDVSEQSYLRVIHSKTAKLFEASAQLGVRIAGGTEQEIAAAARYGIEIGTAFQLIDDLLDYSGNANDIGKNLGDDLREGKPTLPLIHLMQHGSDAQREMVRTCIENGDEEHFDAILAAITQSGALDYTRQQAERCAANAAQAIAGLRDGVYKNSLIELSAFAVSRTY